MMSVVDTFDGTQNVQEWINIMEKASAVAEWKPDSIFKTALFRLRGEAGEFIDQLKAEGKVNNWEDIKKALKERYQAAEQTLFHNHLLNTGVQGNKTVREWAQVVRRLSLLAIGEGPAAAAPAYPTPGTADPGPATGGEGGANRAEAKQMWLDWMRLNNFQRGLKNSIRMMVLRKRCETFDEAVEAAAEEEALEAVNKEKEVFSIYHQGGVAEGDNDDLVAKIVAALEVREGEKERKEQKKRQEESLGKEGRANETRQDVFEGALPLPQWRDRAPSFGAPRWQAHHPAGTYIRKNWFGTWDEQRKQLYEQGRCFRCHEIGHRIRECPAPSQSGNAHRRLL